MAPVSPRIPGTRPSPDQQVVVIGAGPAGLTAAYLLSKQNIAVTVLAQRIQGLSLGRAILAATALTKRAASVRSLIHEFRYPRLGPGQMWERCRDRIVEMGNSVLLEHRVTAVEHAGGRVVAVRARTPDGVERRFAAHHVISSAALPALVRALDPPAPARAIDAAAGLRYRDMLVVGLVLDQADLVPDNWIHIHSANVKVGRIQNFGNWSRAMVPTPGQSALGLEYFCFKNEPFWGRPDGDLVDLATREIACPDN